jgi:hypothetical protein
METKGNAEPEFFVKKNNNGINNIFDGFVFNLCGV